MGEREAEQKVLRRVDTERQIHHVHRREGAIIHQSVTDHRLHAQPPPASCLPMCGSRLIRSYTPGCVARAARAACRGLAATGAKRGANTLAYLSLGSRPKSGHRCEGWTMRHSYGRLPQPLGNASPPKARNLSSHFGRALGSHTSLRLGSRPSGPRSSPVSRSTAP
eukprot:918799-Prymnesium_polylepis.2